MNYKNNNIRIFPDIKNLAEAFCAYFISVINPDLVTNKKINIALSGGNTPRSVYQALLSFKEKIDWKIIFFYWGDERCVPPESAESNFGMAKKYLLDYINIPQENIKRIVGENDPVNEAERYSEIIKSGVNEVNGFPSFDIVVLGLGEDGHTASIFPDQMDLLKSDRICETAYHPATKQKRITLTGKVINNSKNIFFLVTGNNKSHIVSDIVNQKGDYKKFPASYVQPLNEKAVWFLDKEAASELINRDNGVINE